ncbi:MAG: hypothetical protein M3N11_00270 [Actinomycetota bacterium]|nr:hypothetical protein [Actinomycetota bacterium]
MTETSPPRPAGAGKAASSKPSTFLQARIVRRYLSAIEAKKQGKGAQRTSDAIGNRITKIDELLVSADPLTRVHLTQERLELHAEHVRLSNGNHGELGQLERDFVRVARSYGDRNGLTYAAWRQVGVDSKVLDRAGIRRAEKKPPPAALKAAAERAAADDAPASPPAPQRGDGEAQEQPAPSTDAPPPAAGSSSSAAAASPATEDPATSSSAPVSRPETGGPAPVTEPRPAGDAPVAGRSPAASPEEASEPGVGDSPLWPAASSAESDRSPSALFPDDEAGTRG